MSKWFRRKPSDLIDLFRCEFPYEYEWAKATKQTVNEKYVRSFLEAQSIFRD